MGFGDIFRTFFGGGGFGAERNNTGQDLAYNLEITLEEAAKGAEKEIEIPRTERCDVCGGSGAAPGTSAKVCPRCGGSGQVQNMRKSGFAMYVQVTACPTCKGKGRLIETPCSYCHGSGRVRKRRKISVKIPMGIDEGNQLRLRGEGEMGANDAEPGDLYVVVHVKPHPQFIREGDDLLYIAMISYPQAALGAEITVPTLEGPTTIKIHPGTQVGEVITLRGKGMPRFRAYGKGDLMVRVGIAVPEKLTVQQKALLEQLAKEFNIDVKSHKFHF
jgi:molecular chaperone DnaJ